MGATMVGAVGDAERRWGRRRSKLGATSDADDAEMGATPTTPDGDGGDAGRSWGRRRTQTTQRWGTWRGRVGKVGEMMGHGISSTSLSSEPGFFQLEEEEEEGAAMTLKALVALFLDVPADSRSI
ncbi:hypothetical protein Taro_017956 [Colocasia esculenta]|uniref:Uncharacterized protein n=1 Tax=Colocasia esculenta TaxID=4460 RepID=A0A843UPI0_COLES|nr:hypothetical protein [Colocasia esculenta]